MSDLLKILDDIIKSGSVSGWVIAASLGIGGLGFLFFYLAKGITLLAAHFKPASGVSKDELTAVKTTLQDDNKYILKLLSDLDDKLKSIASTNAHVIEINRQLENEISNVSKLSDDIRDLQTDEGKATISIQRDLNTLVLDSKVQYTEITRQVQSLQKDLASLHGTIIGLSTQRSRLK